MIVGKVSADDSCFSQSSGVLVLCTTHCDVAHVSELHILDRRRDVLKVPDVHLDHTGDVHRLHQHVQHDVWHVELKAEEASHLK